MLWQRGRCLARGGGSVTVLGALGLGLGPMVGPRSLLLGIAGVPPSFLLHSSIPFIPGILLIQFLCRSLTLTLIKLNILINRILNKYLL